MLVCLSTSSCLSQASQVGVSVKCSTRLLVSLLEWGCCLSHCAPVLLQVKAGQRPGLIGIPGTEGSGGRGCGRSEALMSLFSMPAAPAGLFLN